MTKHFIRLSLIIFCLFIIAPVCLAQDSIDSEEYVVYSDLLKEEYGDDAATQFAIEKNIDSSFINADRKSVVKKLSLDANLVRDFNERNDSDAEIQNRFNLKAKVNLLDEKEINEVLKPWERDYGEIEQKNWDAFRKKYQTFSLLRVSRAGFNQKRDKALVVFGAQYGWLAGHGYYYLLIKKSGGWKIKKKLGAWVS